LKKTVCIGSVTTDILVSPVDVLPPSGVLKGVDNTSAIVGGCAANSAIDMAKMGIPSKLICKIGNDAFGDFVKSSVEKSGMDTDGLIVDDSVSTTTSVVCISSTGERTFLYNPGSTAIFKAEEIDLDYIDDCDTVFISGTNLLISFDGAPCAAFLKKMQAKGKFTVMDTAWDFEDIWLPKVEASLEHLDLFMPSVEEAEKITGCTDLDEMADFFFERGTKSVIIKTGRKGAYVCETPESRYSVSPYLVENPVDTTGAGDSFCAGFLSGLAMGWDYKRSAQLGNAAGAHCVMAVGGTTGMKPVNELIEFMGETSRQLRKDGQKYDKGSLS